MSEPFLSPQWHRVSALRPRLRGHVQVHRHRYRGQAWYVVQDDVSGRFHRFTPTVYLFVGLMDGRRTVDQLWSAIVTQLGDDAPAQGEIVRLLSQLHAADILQCDIPPDAAELFDRHASHSRAKLRQRFGNPMSIKLSLWDPNHFLDRTIAVVRPLFGRRGAVSWLAAILSAMALAAVHWPELSENVTDRVLAAENLLVIALVFPVLKALHEFGHGYATKVFGGAVREFGLMLIVFAPVPYVDASSSSAFRGKWQRAFVAAAGMLVELFVAALAMFVWVLVEPGVVRAVAYNAMLIAGVSTVVFNANPLLRLDGYYILSDLIEVPNLGARSNRYWGWLVERYAFGADREPPHTTAGERLWLVIYAPLAFVYRMIVMFGIALFVASEFFVVGVLIGTWSVVTGLLWPIWKGLAHVLTGPGLREKRKRAATVTFGAGAACAGLLLLVPAPLHTTAEGVVWLPEESFVRAATDGFINRVVTQPGEQVSPGTPLIESEDPNVLVEARALRSQVEALAVKLEAEQFTDRVQANLTRQELAIRQASLGRVMEQVDQLVIRSGAVGTFVVPRAQDLPGRYVKRGEVVGYIIGPQARVLRVVVTQSDIELVRQRLVDIEVKFPDRPATTVAATMLREVPSGSERLPSKALTEAGGGQLAIDPSDSDQTKTLQRTFQFDLALSEFAPGQFGGRVFVRFAHGSEPLGWQFYRRIRQLLLARFDA